MVAHQNWLATAHIDIVCINRAVHNAEALRRIQRRLLANEIILIEIDEARHACLNHRQFVGELGTPGLITLFDTHTVRCVQPVIDDAEFLSSFPYCFVECREVLHRRMQFPAQLAGIRHTKRTHGNARNHDLLTAEPTETFIAKVGVG